MSAGGTQLPIHLERQGLIVTSAVIGIGFIASYIGYFTDLRSGDIPPFTAMQLLIASFLGAIYLILSLVNETFWRQHFGRLATPVAFTVLILLAMGIQTLLAGSFAIWLISMPLVGSAASDLRRPWNWLVYLIVLLGIFIPIGLRFNNWGEAFFATLTFSPAIIFVVIFVQLARAAGDAQREAEQLSSQLEEANRQLRAYAVQAEELATTRERNRLAREIHDNLGHYLTVINVQIRAAQALLKQDAGKAADALDKAQQYTQEGLAAVRQSVSSLRESPLGDRPLSEALTSLVEQLQASGIVTAFEIRGIERPLTPKIALTLFRTAQEGLTNVRRHARASRVDIALDYANLSSVSLTLQDNGVGTQIGENGGGFGLLGLRERAQQLGGRILTDSAPGKGFKLLVEIPTTPVNSNP
jgi:signal transduction histidine kinase